MNDVAKTSYLVTVPALMIGVSNLIWVPLMFKLGGVDQCTVSPFNLKCRLISVVTVKVISFLLCAAMSAWATRAKTHGSMSAARTTTNITIDCYRSIVEGVSVTQYVYKFKCPKTHVNKC